jgi:hypothetical protein
MFGIKAITGNTVTLNGTLQWDHYGAPAPTIENAYGTLDMRAAVGHLTRNIQINGGPSPNGWGSSVIVTHYLDGEILLNGNVQLVGVQITNGGQYDTQYAALYFYDLVNSQNVSLVSGSAIWNGA